MGYIESLRGSASKRVSVDDIWRQVSKSDDSAVLCVGFFNDASDAFFQIYDEASKLFSHRLVCCCFFFIAHELK